MSETIAKPVPLTARQAEIYGWIYETTKEKGYQPSMTEIGHAFGITCSGVKVNLMAIRKKGLIDLRLAEGRAIRFLFRPDGSEFRGFVDA